jgi:hypothetical protein
MCTKFPQASGKIARMTPRTLRIRRYTHRAAWIALGAVDLAAALHVLPWLPVNIHMLALGACLGLTVVTTWARSQAPVRAAFLDGMLYEREGAATTMLPILPAAVGDGTLASVVKINRQRGRHRPPSPRPR